MISGIINNIIDRLKDPSRSFKERVFILLTLVTCFFGVLALIGDIVFGENIVEIIALVFTAIVVPVSTFIGISKNKIVLAVRVIVVGLVFVLLPILFFFGGGLEGGGFIWIIFTYLYTGLVLSGKWKPMMLAALTVETCLFFTIGYLYPDMVKPHSRPMMYIDMLISVIIVGVVACAMVWFEEWLFQEENKRAKRETEKIEELNKTQNQFFSSMSHEIRTPINSILGLNEIILRQEDASEEIIKDATNIQGAGKMLLALVNDILDLSKIRAGKMDIVPVNYQVVPMLSEIVNMIWLRAEEKGLELKIEVDPSIPSELYGDEVRIKQILINLLNNAVKYTSEGSVTFQVERAEARSGEILLLFSVIDTGMGIKQDVIPHLFDAFQRADEEKNAKIEGTGLGLSIVKQLVDLMNGRITVTSVYTEGSTFTVTLWQKVARPDVIGEVNIKSKGVRESSGKYVPGFEAPDARILIVDDNEMNLLVEKKLLAETRMMIDTARSGQDALSMTADNRYDIILMDHLMPGMDGVECMQNIRKQSGGLNNRIPIIALTANADSENRELYARSGFDGYLLKPVSGSQLEEILLDHLPELKIKISEESEISKVRMNMTRGYGKKTPLLVTTSTMCDLPLKVLRECQIDMIPFSLYTGEKVYHDNLEANTDEVMRYVTEGVPFSSEPPTAGEFEQFFGKEIKKAHQVIYIAVATDISKEFENASEAARAYGNVQVFDSGCNSSAMGFLVLMAHRMATQGRSIERIVDELEALKGNVHCSFITADADIMMKRGKIGKGRYRLINTFGFRPVINIKNGRITPGRLYIGELMECYEKYIESALPKTADPELDLLIVVYIDLSQEDMSFVENMIKKRFKFEHVVFQKVSAVMSLNCGKGALGLAYMLKGKRPYNISPFFLDNEEASEADEPDEADMEEEHSEEDLLKEYSVEEHLEEEYSKAERSPEGNLEEEHLEEGHPVEEQPIEEQPEERKLPEPEETLSAKEEWYEGIQGIDAEMAIELNGSEETFRMILKMFSDTIDSRSDEIKGYYDDEDWKNYTVKIHALKSSAKLIGATKLSKDAEKLEMAGKEGDIDFIKEHNGELFEELKEFGDRLASLFDKEKA